MSDEELQGEVVKILQPFFHWLEQEKGAMFCEMAPYKVMGPSGDMTAWMPARFRITSAFEEFMTLRNAPPTPQQDGDDEDDA